jgi:hypothetical protein
LANFDFDQLVNPALDGLAGEDVQVIVKIGAIAIAPRHSAQALRTLMHSQRSLSL